MSNTSCDPESSLSQWNIADYHLVRVAVISSVIIASMSPVTVTGNLLVVLAIWRNESLRGSTYFLVGALSLEYFVLGVVFPTIIFYKGACHGVEAISDKDIGLLLFAPNPRRPWNIHNCSYDLNYDTDGNRKVSLYD